MKGYVYHREFQRENRNPRRVKREAGYRSGTRIAVRIEKDHLILEPINEKYIRRLRGCFKKSSVSIVQAKDREHRLEK